MISKTKTTASEYTKNIENSALIFSILQSNVIFDKMIPELRKFEKRNAILKKGCCPRCLKAHAVKRAQSMKLEPKLISLIRNLFECETGHLGYYMDRKAIVKV